jgi:hypothetical protein
LKSPASDSWWFIWRCYNVLPYLFFVYMAVGAAWFALLKARSPQILATIQHDMEE